MPRQVSLIVYPIPKGPQGTVNRAHWAVFVPQADSEHKGKVIHVVGTPFTGYGLEFKREYDYIVTKRKYRVIPLAMVDDGTCLDIIPRDKLDAEAKKVDPPGPSPKPLEAGAGKDCQDWVIDYVTWLIRKKIFPETALEVLVEVKAQEGVQGM
ncbi:MAG: hypothetical protein M1817_004803 [Caeruleum heppii]|nr:MAG: hypothetical protein M1817_004803 [Caeruleum heppii]